MITKLQRRQPDQTHLKLLQMSDDVHPNPGPATKYPCPVCTRNVTSRGVSYKCTKCYGWLHAKCSGILNAVSQYRRKGDWTCDDCLAPQSQQSPPPTRSPAPPTKQISDDSTYNVLQLNANGIENKLTELEVVLERNKVKVAVIQESKLSPKSKNPCIRNYTTVRKDRSCSWQTLSTLSSDHLPILIRIQMKTTSTPGLRRTYVNLKKADWDRYRQEVETALSKRSQRDEKIFRTVLLKAASHHIPTG